MKWQSLFQEKRTVVKMEKDGKACKSWGKPTLYTHMRFSASCTVGIVLFSYGKGSCRGVFAQHSICMLEYMYSMSEKKNARARGWHTFKVRNSVHIILSCQSCMEILVGMNVAVCLQTSGTQISTHLPDYVKITDRVTAIESIIFLLCCAIFSTSRCRTA